MVTSGGAYRDRRGRSPSAAELTVQREWPRVALWPTTVPASRQRCRAG